jgi:hypothetical protein
MSDATQNETLSYSIPKMDDRSFHAFMDMATRHEWWLEVDYKNTNASGLSYFLIGEGFRANDYEVVSGWINASDLYRAALKIATSDDSSDVINCFALTGCQDYIDMNSADRILQVALYGSEVFA